MKQRWNANAVALAVLTGLVVIIGGETIRNYLGTEKPHVDTAEEQAAKNNTKFKPGDTAADFTLPNTKGKKLELDALVKSSKTDTLLCFICGCNNCRTMQRYLGELNARLGKNAPQVVSVTSMQPGAEAGYRKDVKLAQTLLYEERPEHGKTSVMDTYSGHPCPRIYRINPERKIVWIGPSLGSTAIPDMAMQVAVNLGFREPWDKSNSNKPEAPKPPAVPGTEPPKHSSTPLTGVRDASAH